ncbi:retrotransposon hot spot (RHS) protein [Trypanosoma cruzi]|nr:retrotransposon hot spot (RHS) protein [Trypanosoma cruzi]
MQASDRYVMMERAARDEMDMEEDLHKLCEHCMGNLLKWLVAAAGYKQVFMELLKGFWMQPPRRRGAQRRRVHRVTWRDATSLCTMRGGIMWWKSLAARGREWR